MTLNFDLSNLQNLDQIVKCIQIGCVPEVTINENHLVDRDESLVAHLKIAKSILNKLDNLLSKLLNNDIDLQIKPRDILSCCLYLCGEHCRPNLPWSDVECYTIMNSSIEKLCNLMHYSNIEELFDHVDVSKIIIGLRFKLENDSWKKFPAAVECFMWILKNLKVRFRKIGIFWITLLHTINLLF